MNSMHGVSQGGLQTHYLNDGITYLKRSNNKILNKFAAFLGNLRWGRIKLEDYKI
jgi:hypothetical protein